MYTRGNTFAKSQEKINDCMHMNDKDICKKWKKIGDPYTNNKNL